MPTLCFAALLLLAAAAHAAPKVNLNEDEFRDRVYACWTGKNIGGTLGMPFEGQQNLHDLTFYTNLKDGQAAPNDDIDLPLLWLKALEEHGGRVDARILGQYWLRYIPVDWNEYGVGKANMKMGLLPPLCGEFNNARWKNSNGAIIRSELWACLLPGCPEPALRLAREDACVDHGAAEGTLALLFMTAIDSAAFVERDRGRLLEIGLGSVPPDCRIARAIRAVLQAKKDGKDWKAARQAVLDASQDTGWFQSPRYIGFVVLGWVYGDGDFGKSLCTTINCGDDTDSTGATLGALLGILGGTKGIPDAWRKPIGDGIRNVAIAGVEVPKDTRAFTDRTVAMTKRLLAMHDAPVAVSRAPTDLGRAGELVLVNPAACRRLWALSPYVVEWNEADLGLALDYGSDPVLLAATPRRVTLTITNAGREARSVRVALSGLPAPWKAGGLPADDLAIPAGESRRLDLAITAASVEEGPTRLTVDVSGGAKPIAMPLTLIGREGVGPDDLALASKGAVATSDGELEREKGCTVRVIDGVIPRPDDFEGKRWHSAIDTPHPHWVQVRLPRAARIGRVVIRFADPAGRPVDFRGLVLTADGKTWREVFAVKDYQDPRLFRREIEPVEADTFRLVIEKSVNPVTLNAAQVSEIELYPASLVGHRSSMTDGR
jgi:ADP-ribosylglycohydrolase